MDAFLWLLFQMVRQEKINCRLIAMDSVKIGFVLWAIDTEELVEGELRNKGIRQCYVSAYGLAQDELTSAKAKRLS